MPILPMIGGMAAASAAPAAAGATALGAFGGGGGAGAGGLGSIMQMIAGLKPSFSFRNRNMSLGFNERDDITRELLELLRGGGMGQAGGTQAPQPQRVVRVGGSDATDVTSPTITQRPFNPFEPLGQGGLSQFFRM